MKLMDEVKLESSVESLESILWAFNGSPYFPSIKQNLQALREVLAGAPATCKHGTKLPHPCQLCAEEPSEEEIEEFMSGIERQRASEPVAWRIRYQYHDRELWDDWRLCEWKPRDRASIKSEIEPLYTHPAPTIAESARKQDAALIAWLRERHANALRLAKGRSGEDAAGWLEDADYFKRAIEVAQK